MKLLPFPSQTGVIAGRENNPDLFIRLVSFEPGYIEDTFHNHPNTFEFYIVLSGMLTFENGANKQIEANSNSAVYFKAGEPHRIVHVSKATSMILLKKVGAQKLVD